MERFNEHEAKSHLMRISIDIRGLTKSYGSKTALSGLTMSVSEGEIYGLLGPNGSGKTTTMKIISAVLKPDSGFIRVLGIDPVENPILVKNKVGYVPETPALYDSLTIHDFFEFITSIRRLNKEKINEKIKALCKAFLLEDYVHMPIASLSLGNRQKVSLIAALLHEPQLLLLDEPLNGLDPRSTRIIKDFISYYAKKGNTIVFSTHIMELAEQLCNRIGIIYKGSIIAEGSIRDLQEFSGEHKTLEGAFLSLTNEKESLNDSLDLLKNTFS